MTHARRRPLSSSLAIVGAMLALPLATPGDAAKRSKAAGCDLGWFVSDGAALLADSAAAARPRPAGSESVRGRVVSLVGEEVSIEGMCARTKAQMSHSRRRTKLRASWKGCLGVTGPVQLKASIHGDECRIMQGRVHTKQAKPKRRRFTATRALGDPRDCTADDTFTVIQKRIFGPKGCRVASCHGEFKAGGLDLRLGAAHASLVGQPATAAGAAGAKRVVPGDPDASFLWRKLSGALGPGEGSPMPAAGAPPLDALELELVRAWIEGEAPPVGRLAEAPCLPHPEFEPAAPLPPPPGGHQLVFEGPVLQPGEEVEGCMWVVAPNTSEFAVGKWEYSLNPGSHHFAVWDHVRGSIPTLNAFDPKDVACLRGGARMDGVTISGSPEAPYFVDDFPAGAGDTPGRQERLQHLRRPPRDGGAEAQDDQHARSPDAHLPHEQPSASARHALHRLERRRGEDLRELRLGASQYPELRHALHARGGRSHRLRVSVGQWRQPGRSPLRRLDVRQELYTGRPEAGHLRPDRAGRDVLPRGLLLHGLTLTARSRSEAWRGASRP